MYSQYEIASSCLLDQKFFNMSVSVYVCDGLCCVAVVCTVLCGVFESVFLQQTIATLTPAILYWRQAEDYYCCWWWCCVCGKCSLNLDVFCFFSHPLSSCLSHILPIVTKLHTVTWKKGRWQALSLMLVWINCMRLAFLTCLLCVITFSLCVALCNTVSPPHVNW